MSKRSYDSRYPPKKRAMKGEYYGRTGQMVPIPRPYSARSAVSGGSDAYRAMNRRSGGFLGRELKFVDTGVSGNMVATLTGAEFDPATVNCLNAVGQGDGESNRDGRKYVMKSVMVKGAVDLAPVDNVTNNDTSVFIALVLDKQTNGAQFNSEDVFVTNSASPLTAQPFRNLQYVQRFDVLASTSMVMNPLGVTYNTATSTILPLSNKKHFEFYKKLDVPVMCTGTGDTVASIADNSLHVVAIAANPGGSSTVALWYSARVRFVG